MPPQIAAFGFRLTAVIGAALVLQFFSEFYFLNEGPAANAARGWAAGPDLLISISVYGFFAYLFLILLDRFAVHSLAGLLLAGSVFGWATEALVVPVAHEAPPVSWLWPSIGWHALVDVIGGWFLLRLAMRRLAWPWLALLFTVGGIAWGFWATWTWGAADEAPVVFTVAEFWTIVLVAGATWIVGTALADIGARRPFRASRWETGGVALATLALFLGTGLAFLPWSAGLGAMIGASLGALALARRAPPGRPNILAPLQERPPLRAYAVMPLLPLAAGATYPFVLEAGLAVPSGEIVAWLFLLGTLGFVWALLRSALDARAKHGEQQAP